MLRHLASLVRSQLWPIEIRLPRCSISHPHHHTPDTGNPQQIRERIAESETALGPRAYSLRRLQLA